MLYQYIFITCYAVMGGVVFVNIIFSKATGVFSKDLGVFEKH